MACVGLHELLGVRFGFKLAWIRPIPWRPCQHRWHCVQLHGHGQHGDSFCTV